MSPWQDMTTAPTDGTWVWIRDERFSPAPMRWAEYSWDFLDKHWHGWTWLNVDGKHVPGLTPEAWAPLPDQSMIERLVAARNAERAARQRFERLRDRVSRRYWPKVLEAQSLRLEIERDAGLPAECPPKAIAATGVSTT